MQRADPSLWKVNCKYLKHFVQTTNKLTISLFTVDIGIKCIKKRNKWRPNRTNIKPSDQVNCLMLKMSKLKSQKSVLASPWNLSGKSIKWSIFQINCVVMSIFVLRRMSRSRNTWFIDSLILKKIIF